MTWNSPRIAGYNSTMTLTLTAEQQQALLAEPNQPLQLVDEAQAKSWYVITAAQFELIKPLLTEREFDPREFYPHFAKTAAAAGWADPTMDVYDNYEPDSP